MFETMWLLIAFGDDSLSFCGYFQCSFFSLRIRLFFFLEMIVAIDRLYSVFICLPGEVIAISFVFDGDSYSPLISALAHRLQRRKGSAVYGNIYVLLF